MVTINIDQMVTGC